jgi:hypothetical protein
MTEDDAATERARQVARTFALGPFGQQALSEPTEVDTR